ncbi:MAG: glycosyltransferase family 39 protein [Anaerolineae bacterium]
MSALSSRRAWTIVLALLGIIALGAVLRLYRLGQVPFGMHPDEAHYALDAVAIQNGWRPIFLPANNGREPLFVYFMALLFTLLGPTLWTARFAGAVVGVLMIPAQYLFARSLPLPRPRIVGLISAALIAFTFWTVSQSHQALRAGLLPVWVALMAWAWWKTAGDTEERGVTQRGLLWSVITGLILAAAVYTHLSARLMPPILIGSALWLAWRRRTTAPLVYLAVALVLAGVLSIPLLLYFRDNPEMANLRTGEVSVLNPDVNKGNLPLTLLRNAWGILLMTNVRGTTSWLENLRGRPVFDPLMGIAFLAGVVLLVRDLLNRRGEKPQSAAVLLVLVYIFQVMPSWLSAGAPSYGRVNGAWAVLFLLPAWALERGEAWLSRRAGTRVATAAVVVLLAISGVWSMADFFGQYANAPEVYDVFFGPSMERARQIAAVAPNAATYMSPTLGNQSVIRFNNVQNEPDVFDARYGLVLPPSGDAQYLFDPADAKDADAFGKRWAGLARTELRNSRDELSLIVYHLPADRRPVIATPSAADHPTFADNMRLINSEIAPASVAPGKTATVTLAWEARAPTETDLNLFVHVVDAAGRTVGQSDGPPLNGSLPTTDWKTGETIIQRVDVPIAKDAGGGRARVEIGWYDWRSGERLPIQGADGNSVQVGEINIGP